MMGNEPLADEPYLQLQQVFLDFQERAEKLSIAYELMQEEFKKVNIELEQKNRDLEHSLNLQKETQMQLNSILESMSSGVLSVDNKNKIIQCNSSVSEITGYTPSELIGKEYESFFTVSSNIGTTEEKTLWHKNRSPIQIRSQQAYLKDAHQMVIGVVEIFEDITHIKKMEKQIQQNKTLAALGEMSAAVAHEIRNPLGAVGVWAQLLKRDLAGNETQQESVQKIIDAISRLNTIVSNLLVYSRPIGSQLTPLPIQGVFDSVIQFVQTEINRQYHDVQLDNQWDCGSTFVVDGDSEILYQVFINVIINALQAMEENGKLTLRCEKNSQTGGDFVVVSIEDTGGGIPEEMIKKIFDPFHTTKTNGTGLGLAIVKKFIEYHNGHINVESTTNVGTTMKIFLPLTKE